MKEINLKMDQEYIEFLKYKIKSYKETIKGLESYIRWVWTNESITDFRKELEWNKNLLEWNKRRLEFENNLLFKNI